MKLDFRQRLLTTTLIVGVSALATPAFAQTTPPPANPTDTAGAANAQPETTTPQEGQTAIPSTNAQGSTVKSSQDIVITGTRIPQPNLTSASPVTVLSSQEVKLQGTTRTEDLINSLPQAFAAQGSNVSNGATGTATVNLRGLGSVRTLVLVNGRRLQPGDPRVGGLAPDINFVPASLIKRVDVLTGGASSVYGADAVAGVVNFIMDTNFTGLRIDAQGSAFMHDNRIGDARLKRAMTDPNTLAALGWSGPFNYPKGLSTNGGAQDISAAFGTGFADGRGHIMAYATYRHQDSVLQSTRDYSFCAAGAFAPQYVAAYGDFYCGGSSTSAQGTFRTTTTELSPTTGLPRNVQVARFVDGNKLASGSRDFNFAPYNYFQRPDERYTFGTFAEYEISPGAKPYLEAMFMHDHTDAQIAPSGSFSSVRSIACDNALLSAQQLSVLCDGGPPTTTSGPAVTFTGPLNGMANVLQSPTSISRRNVEGGGRDDDLEHTAYRIVAGMKGDLLRGLSYDAYYQYGTTRLAETYFNDFSVARLRRATDVVAVLGGAIVAPGTPGAVVECRAVLTGVDPNCVPYNIFQTGGVDQAALAYLQTPGFQRGDTQEQIADANFTLEGGEYGLQTPWSDRGIGLNVGGEYRKESLNFNSDVEFQTGDLAGQGGPIVPVKGSFDVRELFGEIQVPIVSHSFIEDFTLTGGFRYSDYKVGGNHFSTNTYKIAAELAPVRDIRLRASYNRAVRAPNVVELFSPVALGLAPGTTDPCAGDAPTPTAAQCANTGVTAGQYGTIAKNPAGQYNAVFGGNPALTPEKADTYTAGVVLQPRWIPGLAITADYFNIKIANLIGILGFQTTINACIATGSPTFCNLIQRDANGSLFQTENGFITATNLNVGGLQTRGIDVQGSYAHKFGGLGTLNVSLVGTYLKNQIFDTGVDLGTDINGKGDCAGFYGSTCGNPNPRWRHKFRVGFTLPNGLGISGQWRYFSRVKDDLLNNDCDVNGVPVDANGVCPGNGAATAPPGNNVIPAQSFFDLALTARVADKFNLRLGANNILDKEPPVTSLGANGNTFPQVYDSLGRYIFAGVTIDF
jgi:iron complex outermembrane recepter protein